MKTALVPVIFIFATYVPFTRCTIQCYKCSFTTPIVFSNETVRLCKDFDYSDRFVVNCPFSTFCMKRSYSDKIQGVINGTERDCAHQKSENQNYKNGKWQEEISIEEPYREGCRMAHNKGVRTATIENCYCKGDLCNDAQNYAPALIVTLLPLLLIFSHLRN